MGHRAFILRVDQITTKVAGTAASGFLVIAVAAGFWQVVTRFILANPSSWTEALVRLSLIWMVMLGLAMALRHGALVSINIAERAVRGSLRRTIRFMILIANLAFLIVLAWFGGFLVFRVAGQTMAGLELSIALGYAAIPVGAVFAIIGALAHYHDQRNSELEAGQ